MTIIPVLVLLQSTRVSLKPNRFPPGKEIPIDPNASWKIQEYRERFGAVKAQHLQGRKYWYLNLIGRHPERTEPGELVLVIYLGFT